MPNSSIVAFTFVLEKVWLLKNEVSKTILYEEIENIKPVNYDKLKTDVEMRTGLTINRVEVGKIDFLRDVANVTIYYYTDTQKGLLGENLRQKI